MYLATQNNLITISINFLFILPLGYYLPNDDGEFYQFCYVTHKGENCEQVATKASSQLLQLELLTMEDEGNSDMLVVTTKAAFLRW